MFPWPSPPASACCASCSASRRSTCRARPPLLRTAAFFAFLVALPSLAQELPDPGRRLSTEEQKADPEKRAPRKPDAVPQRSEREVRACNNARTYYQISCRAPGSAASYGRQCAEAYALYRENCP